MMHKFKLTFRSDTPPIAWGRPDSPRRALCAICHGALVDVPLIMWNDAGFSASICDECMEKWFEKVEHDR